MIRDDKKLPANVLTRIPALIAGIREDEAVFALYAFGSVVDGALKPLRDLDLDFSPGLRQSD